MQFQFVWLYLYNINQRQLNYLTLQIYIDLNYDWHQEVVETIAASMSVIHHLHPWMASTAQCSIFHLNVTNFVKITKIWPEKKSQFFLILGAIQCQRGTYMVISFNSNTYLSKSIASYSSFFKK